MKKIGQFFEKKRVESRFKRAGPGHSLSEERSSSPTQPGQSASVRAEPSSSAQRAGQAALARLEAKPKSSNKDLSMLKLQVQREIETEQYLASRPECNEPVKQNEPSYHDDDAPTAVTGIFYICPICSSIIPRKEMNSHLEECFITQISLDPIQTTAAMVNTLTRDLEKLKIGKETMCKYIDNLCNNPDEEKYRKIRIRNRIFQERVSTLKGSSEFLQAVGFQQAELPHQDTVEPFLILPAEFASDIPRLQSSKEALLNTHPLRPTVHRDLRVLKPSGPNTPRFHLPPEFYELTGDDVKKQQDLRTEEVEKNAQLRTKAMREADKEQRKYRFCLIRVRFPDGYILQGTFPAKDKLSFLYDFVRGNLVNDWQPFGLALPTGAKLDNEEATLSDLKLPPASVVNFAWDPTILAEITAAQGGMENLPTLKPELLQP